MTTCDQARSRLLEADPAEMRSTADSPLAAHLRDCPRCHALARAILAEQAVLADALAALAPGGSPVESRCAAPAGVPAGVPAVDPAADPAVRRRPSWRGAAAVGRRAPRAATLAAAAAAVALVLFVDSHGRRRSTGPTEPADARVTGPAARTPLVAASGARAFAVIETNDPDLAVIWFF